MTQDPNKRGPGRPEKTSAPYGEKPNLTENQWRALERELRGCLSGPNSKSWPWVTPAQRVAEFAGVTRQSVSEWRREDPEYRRGLYWLLLLPPLATQLARADQADVEQRAAQLAHRAKQIARGDPVDGQPSVPRRPDGFWEEPDPSLTQPDNEPSEGIGHREIEMVAKELVEALGGQIALDLAKARAAEIKREGTAGQRKFWIRVADVIEVHLRQDSESEVSVKGVNK